MVVILLVDQRGQLLGEPKIVSRGFVFEKTAHDLYHQATRLIKKITQVNLREKIKGVSLAKKEIIDSLESLFYKQTGRKPLIVVEVISI